MVIERVVVRAWLQDPGDEVSRVRREVRRGDESWERWLGELERGEAVLATMRVTVLARLADGTSCSVEAENHHLWLEVDTHPPLVEAQIQEVSGKDCLALAQQLQERGLEITADELSEMYAHVELDDSLLRALDRHDGARDASPELRPGTGTETGPEAPRAGSGLRP